MNIVPAEPNVSFTGELEFAGASEDDKTGRTVQFKLVRAPEDMIAAHPFSSYTRRRRGHAGTRFEAVFASIAPEPYVVSCEVMLLHWADGPSGSTVKFLLDHFLDEHPFLGCSRGVKGAAGDRFILKLLELDDDNTIVNQAKRADVERKSQKLSNVAAMIVKNKRFHQWLRDTQEFAEGDDANGWLKDHCRINSKAELDREGSSEAIARFLKMKSAFVDWQIAQGYDLEE